MVSMALQSRVYPRPRGGAGYQLGIDGLLKGLSPPTRGSHLGRDRDADLVRSIPAHAGEPARRSGTG